MAGHRLQGEHLRPPLSGKLIPFLDWLALWRVVPLASPLLEPHGPLVAKARKAGYLVRVDTVVGPALGLSAEGERIVGKPAALRRMSLDGMNERALLHLVAVKHGLPVVGFSRTGLVVEWEGETAVLGWGSGDLKAGVPGSRADFLVELPRQLDFGPEGLPDWKWLAAASSVLPPPTVPMRGRYWTRTLLEAALIVRRRGGPFLEEMGVPPTLIRATRWFAWKRLRSWARVEALLR